MARSRAGAGAAPPGAGLSALAGSRARNGASGPINRFPPWRYALVLVIIVLGAIYAAPNLYPPDYAVQLSARGESPTVPEEVLRMAVNAAEEADLTPTRAALENGQAVIRFPDNETQLRAQDVIRQALVAAGIGDDYIIALNLASTTPEWLENIGGHRMNYGLDLSGGVHFLLEVDMDTAVQDRLNGFEEEIRSVFRSERLRYAQPIDTQREPPTITVRFRNSEDRDRGRALLRDRIREFDMSTDTIDGSPALVLELQSEVVSEIEDYAISQNLQSLRNRVNELGVSEPLVQRMGRNRIVIDLPGIQDSSRAKDIIGRVANLEFRLVASADHPRSETETFEYQGRSVDLQRSVIVTGDRVGNAQAGHDPETNMPQVNITLDGRGGDRMHEATRHNIGRQMAIVFRETLTRTHYEEVDGEMVMRQVPYEEQRLISVATIQAALGNRFRITGLSNTEARDLALLLRAGALAAPMYIVEERTVGASLGEENIRAGFTSVAIGFALVMAFMMVYYKFFGLAANVALAVNLMLLIAVMSLLGATLTLPGIAGIVLTVGMAVDANVLIFSRIREELQQRSPQAAISAGFDRAFVTILDANITTLIVAIILYAIGSGPVRGFAVTLSIGIVTSLFSALMVTRAIVNLMYGGRNVRRLAI